MKKHLLLAVFILCSAHLGAVEPEDFLCELNLSPRPQAIAKLIHTVLQGGVIGESRVREYLESGKNPLRAVPGRPGALSYKALFADLASELTSDERDELRPALSKIISTHEDRDRTVHRAREGARDFIAPKVIRRMQFPEPLKQSGHKLIQGVYQDRPVFFGRFESRNQRDWRNLFFDPFNPNPAEQVVPLHSGVGIQQAKAGAIFKRNGKTIAAFFDDEKYFEIEGKNEVPIAADLPRSIEAAVVVESAQGPVVYGANFMRFFKIGLSDPRAQLEDLIMGDSGEVYHQRVKGREFLILVTSLNRILVLDLQQGGSPVQMADAGVGNRVRPTIFWDKGRFYLFYDQLTNIEERHSETRSLNTVDLKTRTPAIFPGEFRMRSEPIVVEKDGVPHVQFFVENGMVAGNLRTKEAKVIMDSDDVFRDVSPIPWKGATYLAWAFDSKVEIMDPQSQSIFKSQDLISPHAVHFMEYKGESYLFVSTYDGLPYLLRVSGDPQK